MSENPIDHNDIHILNRDGKQIILIGTAHVSRHSAQLVSDTIASEQPDNRMCGTVQKPPGYHPG